MDFEVSEFQTELADGIRRLCEGAFPLEEIRRTESTERVVDRAGWARLGEAGVFHLCLAEEAGGVGLGLAEAALVYEELGRALVPGPLVASHLAAGLVDGADDGSVVVGLVERPVPGAVGTSSLPVSSTWPTSTCCWCCPMPASSGWNRRRWTPPTCPGPWTRSPRCGRSPYYPPASRWPDPTWPGGGDGTAPC